MKKIIEKKNLPHSTFKVGILFVTKYRLCVQKPPYIIHLE